MRIPQSDLDPEGIVIVEIHQSGLHSIPTLGRSDEPELDAVGLLRMTVQQSDLNSRHSLPVSAAEKRHARTVDGGAHRNRQSQVEHDHAVFFRRQGVPRTESNARNRPDVTGKRRCRDRAPRAKEEQSRTTHHPNTNLPILGIFRPQTETRDDRTNVETAVRAMVTGVRQCGFRAAATGQRIRIWIRYVP